MYRRKAPVAEINVEELLNECDSSGQINQTGPDPWHCYSALEHDCVLLVEFCETEGPRVLHMVPTQQASHFQPADFALWLMTADYQTGCRTVASGLHVPADVQSITRNVDQGIHTFAHHFTLFDIQARGFVRPFCLAYLTPDSEKMADICLDLFAHCQNAIDVIKRCNRRIFKKQLEAALEILDSVETQAVSTYYELCYDTTVNTPAGTTSSPSPKNPTKVEAMHLRTRRLHREFSMAYKNLQSSYDNEDNPAKASCSSSHQPSPLLNNNNNSDSSNRNDSPPSTTDSLNHQLREMRQSQLNLDISADKSDSSDTNLSEQVDKTIKSRRKSSDLAPNSNNNNNKVNELLTQQLRAQRQVRVDSPKYGVEDKSSMCTSAHSTTSWQTDHWLDNLISECQLDRVEKTLAPLKDLCPCVHSHFCRQVRQLWSKFHRRSSMLRLFLDDSDVGGAHLRLYADSLPLLVVPVDYSDLNTDTESVVSDSGAWMHPNTCAPQHSSYFSRNSLNRSSLSSRDPSDTDIENNNHLKPTDLTSSQLLDRCSSTTEWEDSRTGVSTSLMPLIRSLPDLLYPLWTGQCLLVCGADTRKLQVMQTVQSLRRLLPAAPSLTSHSDVMTSPYLAWCQQINHVSTSHTQHSIDPAILADYKICGHQLHRNQPLSLLLPESVRPFVSVLDLNQLQTHTPVVKTRLLARLGEKNVKMFTSDRSLRSYARALLADYAQCAYVLYHLLHTAHAEVYRSNVRFVADFAEKLQLDAADFKIVRYLIELLVQQQAEAAGRPEAVDSTAFLDASKIVTKTIKS